MVVVSMDQEQGETAQSPQPHQMQTAKIAQWRPIVIQIVWTTKDQPPTAKINEEDVSWEDLETRLAEIYLKRAEKAAFVSRDADVIFNTWRM